MTTQTRRRIATRALGNTSAFPYGLLRRPARSASPPVGPALFQNLLGVQRRADADERRALLGGDPVVLGGAHREMAQAVLAGELPQGGEVRPALLGILRERRHRHQPHDRHGAALDEGAELGRGDAGLGLLPRDVDLDEHLGVRRPVLAELAQRGVRGDGVDELDVREQVLDLAALELADEVPAEHARVRLGLGGEVLRAVLAEQRHARLGEHPELLERDVLDRGQQLRVADLGADPLGVLAHARRVEAGDQARHTTPAWRPVTPLSARWEKNRSLRHIVHSPLSWTFGTPASASLAATTAGRSRLRSPERAPGTSAKCSWTS